MLRRALRSITVALAMLSILVVGVAAQGETFPDDEVTDTPAIRVVPSVAAANVTQMVPVTVTLMLPGPTGPVTVEVPIFLSLDISIGISPELTPTLAITPSVASGTAVTGTTDADVADTDATEPDLTEGVPGVEVIDVDATVTAEDAEAIPTVAPTPTAPPATATPLPADVEPTAIPLPTATATATTAPEPVAVAPLCPDPRALITSPGVNQILTGTVEIIGTATHENFQYYKVEYAQGAGVDPNSSFAYLADARVQVSDGLLAIFDSANLSNGEYTIKLTVVDNSGNFPPPCTVSVNIEN